MPISMVDGAPRPRGLLDQPNEVLHMIIGFLPDVRFVNFVDEGGIKRNVSQYLVLAQVCQQLRRVVLAANFWQDPEFCFSDLVKGRALDGTDSSRPLDTKTIKVGGLIKALLEDENLLNSLKRKKSWTFDNVESLLIVVMSGAWLTESIEDIRLELKEWEQIPALKCLGFCGKIKRLDICDDSEDCKSVFDLDLISNCLPNLEKLIIDFNRHKGSLEGLGNLTELTLAHSHGPVEIRRERWSDLLPVSSRWTLRRLTIDKVYSVTDVLDNFSNLTHFTLFEPLNGDTVTTFKKLTNVTLQVLRLRLCEIEQFEYLHSLGGSRCLKKLKNLYLKFLWHDDAVEAPMRSFSRALKTIFKFSSLVEHLRLEGGFDFAWYPILVSLRHLKCLELGIRKDAIGCTIGDGFFAMKSFPQLACFKNMSLTEPDGLTAILEKELEFVPKLKISYFEPQNYTWCSDFPMEDYRCLCGEN